MELFKCCYARGQQYPATQFPLYTAQGSAISTRIHSAHRCALIGGGLVWALRGFRGA
jgi:hypothetical protein